MLSFYDQIENITRTNAELIEQNKQLVAINEQLREDNAAIKEQLIIIMSGQADTFEAVMAFENTPEQKEESA